MRNNNNWFNHLRLNGINLTKQVHWCMKILHKTHFGQNIVVARHNSAIPTWTINASYENTMGLITVTGVHKLYINSDKNIIQ